MNRDGAIRINQEPVELPGLAPRLIEIFKTRSDHTVFVQADSELEFNEVVQMIDAAKGAGANRVGLMTAEIAPK